MGFLSWFGALNQGGKHEAKALAMHQSVALSLVGQPVWTPRTYTALGREAYERNPIAHRCVRLLAESAASVPWLLYEGEKEITEHPLLTLLQHPNPSQSGSVLVEQLCAYLQVSGNAYLQAVCRDGVAHALYSLRPDRVAVIPGADGWPVAYEYRSGSEARRFPADAQDGDGAVLHLKLFHPTNDHYGLSPLEAAAVAVDIHNAGGAWAKALLDNAARPSGALIYQGTGGQDRLSEEQFARLKGELEQNFQGARNAGRPLLLEGGLSWTAMSLSPADMDFIEARHVAAREIALAFGVPPMLLGIPGDNTYANYKEANLALWRQTLIPLLTKLASALNSWLVPQFGQGFRLDADLDAVPALNAEREALWERIDRAGFLTRAEKRAAAGYGVDEPLADSIG